MVASSDLVKSAQVWIVDLDWHLIRSLVPNNYPLLLRETTVPMFVEWLKDKAPLCDLAVLEGESVADEGGVLELGLANSFIDAARGISASKGQVDVVIQVKRFGLHKIEVKVDCRHVQAESACAELVLGIDRTWPGALGSMRGQIDKELERQWPELDRELTLLLIGADDDAGTQLAHKVKNWLRTYAIGVRWASEQQNPNTEVRLRGEEGALWSIACGMAEVWPALEPKVAEELTERMQDGLEKRLSRDDRRYLRHWLDEHPPKGGASITRNITSETTVEPRRSPTQREEGPWEKIPDHGYDRKLLEFWHAGYTAKDIENTLGRKAGTIRNRITALRQEYGEEIVPYKRPPSGS